MKINLLRNDENDLAMYLITDVFVQKDYGEISENLVIVDVGANIGAFTLYSVYGHNNVCYAYEPEINNFLKLQENIKLNNLINKVKAFNLGVSHDNSDMKLYKFESIAHSFTRTSDNFDIVHCIDLKTILNDNNLKEVDFLKIDCEGAEFDILYNTGKDVFDKVKFLCVEYHNYSKKENYNGISLIEFLKKQNFKLIEHQLIQNGLLGIIKLMKT